MAHCLVYVNADNSVAIGTFGTDLEVMMGAGRIKPANMDREIAKHLMVDKADEAEFAASWLDFLAARIGTPREVVIRAFVEGLTYGGLTESDAIERIRAKDQPATAVRSYLEDSNILAQDRTFRNAWECHRETIQVNMHKARVIHMDRIRQVRDAELAKLDVPFMRGVETGDAAEQQRIAALKQTLRDIPQTFDLKKYRTPITLKAAWPPELPEAVGGALH